MNLAWFRLKPIACVSGISLTMISLAAAQTDKPSDLRLPERDSRTEFLRMTSDDDGKPKALQTAIARYRDEDNRLLVDLISAIHIADAIYYRQLNRQFDEYEVVLYELVAPEGTLVPTGGPEATSNPISWMQKSTQSFLGLAWQMDEVDYQKKNFVHADLSPDKILEMMQERGDTPLTVGLSALAEILREQNLAVQKKAAELESGNDSADPLTEPSLLELLGDPQQMKRFMAKQFSESGGEALGLGPTLNRLLVTDRNSAAMQVLQQQLAEGKTKIAIFYGAAHMPDFERRLVGELGLHQTKHVWVDAWDLQRPVPGNSANPAALLLRILGQDLR